MIVKNKTIEINSKEYMEFVDITDKVKDFLEEIKPKDGLVNIQSLHTTATVFMNENEPLLLEDIKKNLSKLASPDADYDHDNFEVRTVNMCDDECANGHSHCKALYLPSHVTINMIEGKLQLGTWQRILFVELDRERKRKIQIQVISN